MSHSTFTLFVGVFSVALYLFMTIFVILLATMYDAGAEAVAADASEETQAIVEKASDSIHAYIFIVLADFFVMFIASMLMVYGVKKERHQYLAPWLILSVISLILELVYIFYEMGYSKPDSEHSTFSYIVSAVVSAAIWYPVYKYYLSLKHPQVIAVQASHCPAAGYVAPAPAPVCAVPSDYCHANAKYVPTAAVAAPQHNQVVYPSVAAYKV